MNNTPCLLITADMYTPVLLLTSSQQKGPAEKAKKNIGQKLEEAGEKIEKNGDAIIDKVENAAESLDAAAHYRKD